jgi:hypothetical protein
MAEVDLELFSVDDCPVTLRVSKWTWTLSIGGDRPLDGGSCSVFAMIGGDEVIVSACRGQNVVEGVIGRSIARYSHRLQYQQSSTGFSDVRSYSIT